MKEHVKLLVQEPAKFTTDHVRKCVKEIMTTASPAQTASFLTAFQLQRLTNGEMVAAIADEMRQHSLQISAPGCVDIVGTGGDGMDTFNVSTAAAIICAGAGCRVAKHGNRASSSACGSADVLEAIGADITNLSPTNASKLLENDSAFAFLFSQTFHPLMKRVAAIRKELGFKTVFNIIGPLCNPVQPSRLIVGVAQEEFGLIIAQALLLQNVEFAWVVHGLEGLDEISPSGKTIIWQVDGGKITEKIICVTDFGLEPIDLKQVCGGNVSSNAKLMLDLLNDRLKGPVLDFCLINAAALLLVAGKVDSLKKGVQVAQESISSKKALDKFNEFKAFCKSECE